MNRRAIAAVCIAILVAEPILLFTDTGPNIALVAVVIAVVGVAIWFPASFGDEIARPIPAPVPPDSSTSFPDLRTTTLRQALATGGHDTRPAERVRQQLVAIVDDELLAVHGIDRDADPEAARAVLGDELHLYVTDPTTFDELTPRRLSHIVTLIERI